MADEHEQPEREWDEYEWERFLQNQDLRTERYLELLERYVDHPERDVLIAREMGWFDCSAWEGDWEAERADCQDPSEEETRAGNAEPHGDGGGEEEDEEVVEEHPLYRIAFELTVWLDGVLEARGSRATEHPAALELAKQACILGGKVAAALSGGEQSETGMTIAYLKRALRAANLALSAYAEVHREHVLGRVRDKQLREKLFEVRDAIVLLMGHLRAGQRGRPGQ